MSDKAPSTLGKYEVVMEIDRGSMGIVYLGHDPFIDRSVAIKLALADSLSDDESGTMYRKMFFNEAHTAGKLAHPNVVHIFDAGMDGDNCYIVMEYIKGGDTLKTYTKPDKLLPTEKVVEIIFKCANALDYAHRQGVVHRDIKPSNILVTEDMDVKIGDFSIAHMVKTDATETMPIGFAGSPRYMSPEQVQEDFVGSQTDLYSLGVVMYELLTGKPPYRMESISRLIHKIVNEPPIPVIDQRSDLPEVLVKIVERAMQKDPDKRYLTGMEFAADLSQAFDHLERPREELSAKEKFETVKELDFFLGFPEPELWEIINASIWQGFEPGDELVVEGEIDDCFFIIVSGVVDVRKGERVLRTLNTGDCFGEMGYLAKTRRTASIVGIDGGNVLKINSSVVSQVSLNCQVRFLKVFLRTLIHRLSQTTEKVSQQDEAL